MKLKAGKLNGLTKDSSADTFQVRSVAEGRLVNKLGALNLDDMGRIAEGLKIVLELGE